MPIAESRKTQQTLIQEARQQISIVPEETRHIQRKILLDTREQIEHRDTGINPSEYQTLKEKLDMAYGFTKSIVDLKQSQTMLLEKLDNNFNTVAQTGEKATLWKKIFSGGFTMSFIVNLIAVFGFMIKVPNARLEKQLKELMIVEKKAQLEKNGIDLRKYS